MKENKGERYIFEEAQKVSSIPQNVQMHIEGKEMDQTLYLSFTSEIVKDMSSLACPSHLDDCKQKTNKD